MAYKLLLVDDEKDTVDILEKRFKQEKFEVVSAFDGEEALLKMEEGCDPDVILLDLMLPKLNGVEVLREIRQKYTDKWRPVIIVSAKTELESFEKCYSLEADHYLTKPCNFEDILQGVITMISLIGIRK